ncbi:putative PPPDE peptidase domain-containing protein [Helianthus annuus]|nr:putative PPPDE peptidase domain-containing protein [Helianthus annuus]
MFSFFLCYSVLFEQSLLLFSSIKTSSYTKHFSTSNFCLYLIVERWPRYEEGQKVSLHVYDLSQGLAMQVSTSLLGKPIEGIWHTGIVLYGNEYYFGDGIQQTPVGTTPYGTPLKVIDLGVTKLTKDEFDAYLKEIGPRYTHETYNILKHNCNCFSNEVAQHVAGTTIPEYILNLPNEVLSSPLAPLIMPLIQNLEATLRDGDVPQGLQFQAPIGSAESSNSDGSATANTIQPMVDPLGNARSVVQEEIAKEFAALRASGTMSPSEAAALATKNVMQKHGFLNPT